MRRAGDRRLETGIVSSSLSDPDWACCLHWEPSTWRHCAAASLSHPARRRIPGSGPPDRLPAGRGPRRCAVQRLRGRPPGGMRRGGTIGAAHFHAAAGLEEVYETRRPVPQIHEPAAEGRHVEPHCQKQQQIALGATHGGLQIQHRVAAAVEGAVHVAKPANLRLVASEIGTEASIFSSALRPATTSRISAAEIGVTDHPLRAADVTNPLDCRRCKAVRTAPRPMANSSHRRASDRISPGFNTPCTMALFSVCSADRPLAMTGAGEAYASLSSIVRSQKRALTAGMAIIQRCHPQNRRACQRLFPP